MCQSENKKNAKVVIITGTRTGVGRALAEIFLKKNFVVYGCSRLQTDLKNENYNHRILDITNMSGVTAWVSEVYKKHEKIDVLINNAGKYLSGYVYYSSTDSLSQLMETNFIAHYHIIREVSKFMLQTKFGRIVNISSIATKIMAEGVAGYAVSKLALENFSKILAKELACFGVTCNTISIPLIETSMTQNMSDEIKQRILSNMVFKRFANIEDIYQAISFLIDEKSEFITGQVLRLGYVES